VVKRILTPYLSVSARPTNRFLVPPNQGSPAAMARSSGRYSYGPGYGYANGRATTTSITTAVSSTNGVLSPVRQSFLFSQSPTSRRLMAVGLSGGRHAADEEARAEVDVLNSRLEKTAQLTKKIQACLGRLEETGKSVRDVAGPLNGETKRLQVLGNSKRSPIPALRADGKADAYARAQTSSLSSELSNDSGSPPIVKMMRSRSSAWAQTRQGLATILPRSSG